MISEKGLTYDDVLIKPKPSRIKSRSDVDISSEVFDDKVLDRPVFSANMDTVTESEMAQSMTNNGGCGVIHRFMDIEEQAKEINKVDGLVGGSVGVKGDVIKQVQLLLDNGADFIVADVANGYMERFKETIKEINEVYPETPLMAGNVATKKGVRNLYEAGADTVKVGIGPGSLCTTRIKAGVGIPQLTAVIKATQAKEELLKEKYHIYGDKKLRIVADGGIKRGGDMSKALGAGADAVMIGGLFASCPESPTEKNEKGKEIARGMASKSARKNNNINVEKPVEGGSVEVEQKGSTELVLKKLCNGVKSSFSYAGAKNIREFHDRVEFIKVSPTTQKRNQVHLGKN